MAMGHVVLREFFVDRQTPYFTDYVKRFTDLPFLVGLDDHGDGTYTAGKFLTAADLGERRGERRSSRRCCSTRATGEPVVPNGSLGFHYGDAGAGRWNLDLGRRRPAADACWAPRAPRTSRCSCRASTSPSGAGALDAPRRARAAGGRPAGHHRVRPAAGQLRRRPRRACPATGRPATTTRASRARPPGRRRSRRCPAVTAARIGREFAANAEASRGRSMIVMGAGTNH